MNESPQIIIAGASGYIGKAIIPQILERFPKGIITALSRGNHSNDDPRVKWQSCDLFCLQSLRDALPAKADAAIYLVHSMGPTAYMDQGAFADYDVLLADNFARVVKELGIKQLIYLGGLIPPSIRLSKHLQSRQEMEEIFHQFQLPTTIFRASIILGEKGSSFQILLKLVKRLPIMICPRWTQTLTTPVDLNTVLDAIVTSLLVEKHIGKIYDLAGCEPITYIDMMRQTAKYLGKKRYFFTVSFFTPTLSRLWVSLITNTSKTLIYPLIESLEHPMVARPAHFYSDISINRSYIDLLKMASFKIHPGRSLFNILAKNKTIRSVQRMELPAHLNVQGVKKLYIEWLPVYFYPFIKIHSQGTNLQFSFIFKKWVLLDLSINCKESDLSRQMLYIIGGCLVANKSKGQLEFREVLNKRFVIVAIHDYTPALPWFIYRYTQAIVHLKTMQAFAKHLMKYKEIL